MSETPRTSDDRSQPSGHARKQRVSGQVAALWLVICLLLTAVLIPMALKLPHWIEFEIVLGIWWIVWFSVLSWFLYQGFQVTDDHTFHQPRNWFSFNKNKSE